jgi:hypothetical protein
MSTVFTTEVHTVTACPPSVPNCPASEMATYIPTETVAAYTTMCPVSAEETSATSTATSDAGREPSRAFTTATIYTTEAHTSTAYPLRYWTVQHRREQLTIPERQQLPKLQFVQ